MNYRAYGMTTGCWWMRAGALEKLYTGPTLSSLWSNKWEKCGIKTVWKGNFAEQSLGGVYYSLPEVGTWLKRWIWCFGKCECCQWALLSSITRGNCSLWRTIRKPRASQQILLKMLHIKMILNTSREELSEETWEIHKNLEINMTSYINYCETTYSNMIVLN